VALSSASAISVSFGVAVADGEADSPAVVVGSAGSPAGVVVQPTRRREETAAKARTDGSLSKSVLS
jgi:hypothetical protein